MTTALAVPTTRALATTEEPEPSALEALKARDQQFAIIYVDNGGNGCDAYRRTRPQCTSNQKTVQKLASRLANTEKVTRAIQEVLRLKGFTAEGIHSKLIGYATNKPSRFAPFLDGSKTLAELELEGVDSSCIQEILVIVKPGSNGDQVTRKLRFYDAQQAVTTLGKMLGLLDERKHVTLSGVIGVAALDLRDKSGEELDTITAALTTSQPPPKLIDAVVTDSVTTT